MSNIILFTDVRPQRVEMARKEKEEAIATEHSMREMELLKQQEEAEKMTT